MELIGNVDGKNVILVDDMVDTAGTLSKAADLLIERGAVSVRELYVPMLFFQVMLTLKLNLQN